MDRVSLPDTVEDYITKLQSSGSLQLSFKIMDNCYTKTLVLIWKSKPDPVVQKPKKHKSPAQLARDRNRSVTYRRNFKDKLSQSIESRTVSQQQQQQHNSSSLVKSKASENIPVNSQSKDFKSPPVQTAPKVLTRNMRKTSNTVVPDMMLDDKGQCKTIESSTGAANISNPQALKSSCKSRPHRDVYCKDCHQKFDNLNVAKMFKCKSCNFKDFHTLTEQPISWVVCATCVIKHRGHKDLIKAAVDISDDGRIRI